MTTAAPTPIGGTDGVGMATAEAPALRVGVFGHYGNRNLGDEAIITAVIGHLRAHVPNVSISCFSLDPADTSARYGVPAFHIRRVGAAGSDTEPLDAAPESASVVSSVAGWRQRAGGLARSIPGLRAAARTLRSIVLLPTRMVAEARFLAYAYRRVRELDLLLISGSNQFLDNFGGPWGFPWTLLRWVALAKFAGTRVAFLSIGAGPIDARSSRLLVRLAVRLADYTSYRDEQSRRLIEVGRLPRRGTVFPDLAHGLRDLPTCVRREWSPGTHERPIVGINPMPIYDERYWHAPDSERYDRYVSALAAFASELLRREYPIFFYSTQPKDEDVIDDVVHRIDPDVRQRFDASTMVKRSRGVDELLSVVGSADVLVPLRFHGALLGLLMERLVIAVAYGKKTADLMHEMGQGDLVLTLDELEPAELLHRLQLVESNAIQARARIRARKADYRSALHEQYRRVLSLVGR